MADHLKHTSTYIVQNEKGVLTKQKQVTHHAS